MLDPLLLELSGNVSDESTLGAFVTELLGTPGEDEVGASVFARLDPLLEFSGNVPNESTLRVFVTKLLGNVPDESTLCAFVATPVGTL